MKRIILTAGSSTVNFRLGCTKSCRPFNEVRKSTNQGIWCIGISIIWILTATLLPKLNYPDLVPCWPHSLVGRASEDLIWRLWVQTPPLWLVGTPKFSLIRVYTQGLSCIGSIAYFWHLIGWFKLPFLYITGATRFSYYIYTNQRVLHL